MRVLIINTYYAPEIIGGAEYSVKKLAETLVVLGHDVSVLCTFDEDKEESIDGVKIFRFKSRHCCRALNISSYSRFYRVLHRVQDLYNQKNVRSIEMLINKINPDVIHTNGLYDISPVVWKIAADKGVRVIHTLRDYYLTCPRVTCDCENAKNGECTAPKWYCKLQRKVNRVSSKYVDVVTAPSKKTLDLVLATGCFDKAEIKKVVPNAIDFDEKKMYEIWDARKKRLNSEETVKFVYLGALNESKGVKWLLEAFTKIQNAELYFAGRGALEKEILEASRCNSNIKFMGFLSEENTNKLLRESDVLICPSIWNEPFGRVILDAYKNAMPVIASNRGALPEIVDNSTGVIVQSGDTNKLVDAINEYIINREKIVFQGWNAMSKIHSFSLKQQAYNFLRLYEKDK